jgi:hypothetical protein
VLGGKKSKVIKEEKKRRAVCKHSWHSSLRGFEVSRTANRLSRIAGARRSTCDRLKNEKASHTSHTPQKKGSSSKKDFAKEPSGSLSAITKHLFDAAIVDKAQIKRLDATRRSKSRAFINGRPVNDC